jgi:hypothetical protein
VQGIGRLRPQIKYSPKSIQGAVGETILCIILEDSNGNRNVAYFNWNSKLKQWVVNFNWNDNNFNRYDRFVCPRYCLLSPPFKEEFLL